jgi:hypothetical protein
MPNKSGFVGSGLKYKTRKSLSVMALLSFLWLNILADFKIPNNGVVLTDASFGKVT